MQKLPLDLDYALYRLQTGESAEMNLKKTLDDFASKLAGKASKDDTPLQESTDAFKAVTAYYSAQRKTSRKSGDDEPESDGFSFADGVGEAEHGGTNPKVPARRNS